MALIHLVPFFQEFYLPVTDLVFDPEEYVTGVGLILTVDIRQKTIAILHLESGISALDVPIFGVPGASQ